ncbi:hypothetical protein C0995_010019 [Termitomyces sp. Mi166|nr:hypothetical protein C0995_010019 [Termitomyces sp. Mi166\
MQSMLGVLSLASRPGVKSPDPKGKKRAVEEEEPEDMAVDEDHAGDPLAGDVDAEKLIDYSKSPKEPAAKKA